MITIRYEFKGKECPKNLVYKGIEIYKGSKTWRVFRTNDIEADWKEMLKACESIEEPICYSSSVDHFVMDNTGYCFQSDENGQEMLEKIRMFPRLKPDCQVTEVIGGVLPSGEVQIFHRQSRGVRNVKGHLEITWAPKYPQKSHLSCNVIDRIQLFPDGDASFDGAPCWRIRGFDAAKAEADLKAFLLKYATTRQAAWNRAVEELKH